MTLRRVSKTGNRETLIQQDDHGCVTDVYTIQKADKLIDKNRTQRNADRKGSLIGNTQAHLKEVADIPANLYYDLVGKHGTPQQNPTWWKRWLNDYDNRVFRTSEGSV